jgi:hypothetical protein
VHKQKEEKKVGYIIKVMNEFVQQYEDGVFYSEMYDKMCVEYNREESNSKSASMEFSTATNNSDNRLSRLEQYEKSYTTRELRWRETVPQTSIQMPIKDFSAYTDREYDTRCEVRMSNKGIYNQTKLPSVQCRVGLNVDWQNPDYHYGNDIGGFTENSREMAKNAADPNGVYLRDVS